MKSKFESHLSLFYTATSFWTFFFLGGLWSDYYQNMSFVSQLVFIFILPAFLLTAFGSKLIRTININASAGHSLIAALYFVIPFQTYDFIYIYIYQGKSILYLLDYWYLTFFSLIPILVFPLIAYFIRLKKVNMSS
jgi:hypothetical protein